MQSALLLIIFIFLYIGLLYPTLAIVGYDIYSKPNTLSTIIRWRKREHDIWQTTTLYNILQIVAPLIPLSESSEKKMNEDLARADIPFNAKEYYAKAILSSIGGILVALIGSSMNSTLIVVGGILLCIYLFFKNYDQLGDTLKNKYAIIEDEIPQFIRSIESGLHTDRDIIRVLERYNRIASPAMRSELEVLLADMQTSNVQRALMRFDNRAAPLPHPEGARQAPRPDETRHSSQRRHPRGHDVLHHDYGRCHERKLPFLRDTTPLHLICPVRQGRGIPIRLPCLSIAVF